MKSGEKDTINFCTHFNLLLKWKEYKNNIDNIITDNEYNNNIK